MRVLAKVVVKVDLAKCLGALYLILRLFVT